MNNKTNLWLKLVSTFFFILILTSYVNASARVAVLIEIPEGGVYTKCFTLIDGTDAYEILEKTGLDLEWSDPSDNWGHGLCSVKDIGCPKDECFTCNGEKKWLFYIKQKDKWKEYMKSFDLTGDCNEHYCATTGDLLGFVYGTYGTKPGDYDFEDICTTKEDKNKEYELTIEPAEYSANKPIKILITDKRTEDGIKDAEVQVYTQDDKKVLDDETDSNGELVFTLEDSGEYTIKINVAGYEDPRKEIDITVKDQEGESTTSTSQATSTTEAPATTTTVEEAPTTTEPTTTSTTEPPTTTEETTTTSISTTSTEPSTTTSTVATSTTLEEDPDAIGMVTKNPVRTIFPILLIILAALGIYSFTQKKKKGKKKSLSALNKK